MSLDDEARDELQRLEAAGRLRVPRVVDGVGAKIVVDGREVVNLASNDYLGLAGDQRLAGAGSGAGASRLITGNHRAHVELEAALADWMHVGAARLFNTGYAANTGAITALVGAGDVVFSDELNHASIIDGCRLSRAQVVVFPHRDLGALERALSATNGRRKLVVSETLFSMDGDLADVAALSALCARFGAALMLDEAHAIGARGPQGRGVAAEAGVVPDLLVGTCGKALGVFGAFVATTPAVAELLWNRARTFVFSTALPPMVCSAIASAIAIVRGDEGDARRAALRTRARALRARLGLAGETAIVPLVVGDDREVMRISERLLAAGVFVQGIRPPTVPEGTARLRVAVSAGIDPEDLERAMSALDDAVRR
jgi:8-amino-7-oxononanoate synthase